jgi:hypothetical protein
VLGLSLQFLFLLISEWGAPTNSFKETKEKASHLIGPSPIFLEHGGTSQHKNLNMLPIYGPPSLYTKLYTWPMNHGQIIWNEEKRRCALFEMS